MTRFVNIAVFLFMSALVLEGCAASPATGRHFFTTMSPSEEASIGAEAHPKILAQFGGAYNDQALQNYVTQLGQNLASKSERTDVKYTFTIVNSPDINAFAIPGGYIYVTRGLMALANSEAELAGVISHEIGHITARHSAERQGDSILLGGGAFLGQLLGAVTGLSVIGDITAIGAAAQLQSYSRDQEFEADTLGVRYLSRASYTPRAMSDFLDSLQRESQLEAAEAGEKGDDGHTDIFASHPRTMDRVQRAIEAAGPNPDGKEERDAYLNRVAGLIFGDDADQGFVRHQRFIHPKLLISFDAPSGYRLINQPDAVLAVTADKSRLIHFSFAMPQPQGDLENYLATEVRKTLPLRNIQAFPLNQFEAATGIAVGRTRSGKDLAIRVVVLRDHNNKSYLFQLAGSPRDVQNHEGDLQYLINSFRQISPSEAQQYKSRRIALVTVGPKDTQESLAQRMMVEGNQLEWFRVLNRLNAGDRLVPGQRLKIVVE